ncbi:SbcC/MukB-like Walker B domain-containing protein [Pseudomonas sp. 273]|uniref:SbcC/MukB-like Walker B domain-containing protein n=1 Tax=Pseudomonas sp. 273 TaxID=75692 RepID=UPI0023D850C5|nr:SbcC/MukB-like Walker B domain-containing protein [Pseudomonas sp. 273]
MKRLESVKLVQFLLYEAEVFPLGEVTGIFGLNGSGKSSALDAVQVAMFGANASSMAFNAQANSGGARQTRTLRSYCLGQYGDDASQCVRPNATTYITLTWRNLETNEPITAGICIEASLETEDAKVLGRYVISGGEIPLGDHLQTVDGVTAPLPWNSFRHRLLERAKAVNENPFFDDATSFTKQILFALRGNAGQPTYDAFVRSFRFALRMRFDKSVDQIVRQDVLESRPTNIKKFKAIVESFKRLTTLVDDVEKKIEHGQKVVGAYRNAQSRLAQAASWRFLGALAEEEEAQLRSEQAQEQFEQGTRTASKLRAESEKLNRRVSDMEIELGHLSNRQQTHKAHQENVSAQIDQTEAVRLAVQGQAKLRQELTQLAGTLRQLAQSTYLGEWLDTLSDLEQLVRDYISDMSGQLPEELQAQLGDLHVLGARIEKALDAIHLHRSNRADVINDELRVIDSSLKRVSEGKAPLSPQAEKLINELKDHGLNPIPVCDLIKVTDAQWQPAIEAYLASNVEALLLPADQEGEAFDIYRGLKEQRAIYGVKIVRSGRVNRSVSNQQGRVSELITGTDPVAVAYVRNQLGSLTRANQREEALAEERTLTMDGMLVTPEGYERLRLNSSKLKIGEAAMHAGRLNAERRQLAMEMAGIQVELGALVPLRQFASAFSSQTASKLLLNLASGYREALHQRELANQRVERIADAEYLDICRKLEGLQGEIAGARETAQAANNSAIRAELGLETLKSAVVSSALRYQSCIDSKQDCKTHVDFNESHAMGMWDKVTEKHEDAQALIEHCRSQAKTAEQNGQSLANAAQNELWGYQREYQEFLDEQDLQDWRRGKVWIEGQVARLVETELPAHKERAQDAYQASQDTFRKDVALALNNNLQFLRQTFKRLNSALEKTPLFSNGERYQFIYSVRKELKPLLDFVKSVADMGVDGGLFGDPGSVPPQFEELLREKTVAGNAAVKSPLDDYREFFEFDVRIDRVDSDDSVKPIGHLSRRIGQGSGGEHRAPLYVIAGAGLWSAYRMDQGDRDGLRLILLDEAFDKMDPSNVIATMRYLQELGLQVLMASPGENLGTLNAFLNCYFEIQKDPVRHTIQVDRVEVSEAMREQFRVDLWEFNPDLIEQEIEAMRSKAIVPGLLPDQGAS